MAPVANRYDAVIIGGGHNGLTAAAYLARAGRTVLVLERRHVLGGAAVTEEVFPGFRFSEFSYVVSLLRPEIIRELELPKHGLEILPLDGTITPLDDDYLWRVNDHGKTIRELRRWSKSDAEAYEEYGLLMADMARFIKPILSVVPPDPGAFNPFDWMPVVGLAKTFRDLPERLQSTFVQLMTMSATEFLRQWFETDPLIATMSASGIIGTFQGVRSPGTAYVLLHHYMGEIDGAFRAWGIPRGGTGGISEAIASAARAAGVEIRTEAPVARIDVATAGPRGVVLESGEEDRRRRRPVERGLARHVPPPGRTLEPRAVVPGGGQAVQVPRLEREGEPGARRPARARVSAGKGEWLRGAISFSPGVDYMERAYDDAKYGRFSTRPYIDCIIPTLVDPSMAPPGKHVMSCFVQYAPYHLSDGRTWDDAERDAFGETVIATLEERFPSIRNLILHRQVLTPLDIERITGLTEGNIFQGELSLEQLFFNRPGPGVGPLPDADQGPVDVRLGHASGWRDHGRAGRIAALELLGRQGRALGGQGRLMAKAARRDRRRRGATTVSPTAAYLAKAGRSVLVLEKREPRRRHPRHVELAPGVRGPGIVHTVGRLRKSVIHDLGLVKQGLVTVEPEVRVFAPQPEGPPLTLWADAARTAAELRERSAADGEAYPAFDRKVRSLASFLSYLHAITPPDVKDRRSPTR
jgi:phytoene dehydrogenase-like protein